MPQPRLATITGTQNDGARPPSRVCCGDRVTSVAPPLRIPTSGGDRFSSDRGSSHVPSAPAIDRLLRVTCGAFLPPWSFENRHAVGQR